MVNHGAMNMVVQISLWDLAFSSFECTPRNGIAGSWGNSMSNVLGHFILFPSGCTIFYSHQECRRVLFPPAPCQHLLFSVAIEWMWGMPGFLCRHYFLIEALKIMFKLGFKNLNNVACKYTRRYFRIISKLNTLLASKLYLYIQSSFADPWQRKHCLPRWVRKNQAAQENGRSLHGCCREMGREEQYAACRAARFQCIHAVHPHWLLAALSQF